GHCAGVFCTRTVEARPTVRALLEHLAITVDDVLQVVAARVRTIWLVWGRIERRLPAAASTAARAVRVIPAGARVVLTARSILGRFNCGLRCDNEDGYQSIRLSRQAHY